jgi:glycosyltransferase involved in cell wall biosynthesis
MEAKIRNVVKRKSFTLDKEASVKSPIKAVIVSCAPEPYRVPGWRHMTQNSPDINFEAIYCSKSHTDTSLDTEEAHGFVTHFLTGHFYRMEKRFLHYDFGIWYLLNKLRPDVVITTGFIPTYLIAFVWAVTHGAAHIAMTDGTAQSEKTLSWLHRFVRRIVFRHSAAFVGACDGSRELFRQYGVPEERIHLSRLCVDNTAFLGARSGTILTDFIFCGRLVAHKRPQFAMQVAQEVAIRLGRRTSIDLIGRGTLEPVLREYAAQISSWVDTRFHGYLSQAELPSKYRNGLIFLFPTEWDPWGVVANEACASGLPVIVSPHAGVAGELVIEGENGYIRELDVTKWAEAAIVLIQDKKSYDRFSRNSRARVTEYTFENAASGLANAIRQAKSVISP